MYKLNYKRKCTSCIIKENVQAGLWKEMYKLNYKRKCTSCIIKEHVQAEL